MRYFGIVLDLYLQYLYYASDSNIISSSVAMLFCFKISKLFFLQFYLYSALFSDILVLQTPHRRLEDYCLQSRDCPHYFVQSFDVNNTLAGVIPLVYVILILNSKLSERQILHTIFNLLSHKL